MVGACGCPKVIADEVNYPAGNYLLSPCQATHEYVDQLPGYQSVYDPLAQVAPAEPVAMEVPSMAAPAPLAQPQAPTTASESVAESAQGGAESTGAYASLRQTRFNRYDPRLSMRPQPSTAQPEPSVMETIQDAAETVTSRIRRAIPDAWKSRMQRSPDRTSAWGARGAEVRLGPVAIPTTRGEWQSSWRNLKHQGRDGFSQGAQVGSLDGSRAAMVVGVILAVVAVAGIVAYVNRDALKKVTASSTGASAHHRRQSRKPSVSFSRFNY